MHGGQLSDNFDVKTGASGMSAVAVPLHAFGRLDHENVCRRKKEWHTVDTVVTAR